MNRLKKILLGLLLFITAFLVYAFYTTRNSVNMTTRQKLLKAAYPVVMWFSKLAKSPRAISNNDTAMPAVPFYSLSATAIDGTPFDFSTLKGKKIMLVNTASDCGFTDQYAGLETLYQQYKGQLEIIAFPANDFKEQEKGDNAAIAAFCKKNYGVTFPIMSKTVVIKSGGQDPVFKWLTDPAANGWNSKAPTWNFCKYLVNEKGQLTHFFETSISPLSDEVKAAIEKQ